MTESRHGSDLLFQRQLVPKKNVAVTVLPIVSPSMNQNPFGTAIFKRFGAIKSTSTMTPQYIPSTTKQSKNGDAGDR